MDQTVFEMKQTLWIGQMRVSKANEGLCSVAGKEEPTPIELQGRAIFSFRAVEPKLISTIM